MVLPLAYAGNVDDRRAALFGPMLEAAGFFYNKAADCWVHSAKGLGVSRKTLNAHDEAWLKAFIASNSRTAD